MSTAMKLKRLALDLADENDMYRYTLKRIAEGWTQNPRQEAQAALKQVIQEPTGKGVIRQDVPDAPRDEKPSTPPSMRAPVEKPGVGQSGQSSCEHGTFLGLHCSACGGWARRKTS